MDQEKPMNESVKKIAELIDGIEIAMMTTLSQSGTLHSRPMVAQQQEFDGELWFMTGKDTIKTDEIDRNANVNIAFSAPDDDRYVSISGKASIVTDQSKINELWSPVHKAWFPEGKDSPNIALIRIDPEIAEYWDSSNKKLVQVVGFLKSIASGERYEGSGSDHGSVKL